MPKSVIVLPDRLFVFYRGKETSSGKETICHIGAVERD